MIQHEAPPRPLAKQSADSARIAHLIATQYFLDAYRSIADEQRHIALERPISLAAGWGG